MSPVIKVVQPSGILDSAKGALFREEITALVEDGAEILLVDFQKVTFMDSSGLGAVVLALKRLRASGGKLYLCSINEQVKMLFDLTGMDKVFEIFPNREEFEKAIGPIS